jgi:hypothetical protein
MNKKLATLFVLLCALAFAALLPTFFPAQAFQDEPVLTDAQKKLVANARDAARSADRKVVAAEETRRSANGKVTLITSLSAIDNPDDVALRSLEELAGAITSVSRMALLTALDDHTAELTKAQTDLTTARDALPAEAAGEADEISAARRECNEVLGRIDKQNAAEQAAKKKLIASLVAVPPKIKALAELLPPQLAPLASLDEAEASALRSSLAEGIPNLARVWRLKGVLRQRWVEIKMPLQEAVASDTAAVTAVDGGITATQDALKAIDDQAAEILPNLQPAFDKLRVFASGEASKTGSKAPDVIRDPAANSPDALLLIRSGSDLHADLNRINQAWIALTVELRGVSVPNFDLSKTAKSAQDLADADKSLNITISALQDAITGDASKFVADQVSLYYFTDVQRIMQMLNSATFLIGGLKDAQERAALERRKLTETELDLADAQAEVNKDQRRVVELQEELRQAKAGFASSETVLLKASRNLKGVQADDKKNQDRLTKAKADADAAPTDPEKQLALQRASDDADKSAARLKASELRNEDATRERDAAKERNDALTNEQTGLPTKIQQARDTLEAAQSAVSRQRRAAFLAAQTESEAFAMARDNTPFWFGPAVGSSPDPVKRVLLYAFTDSKTIFLRGKPDDVAVVKDIIARFDSPAPQARLTLWTLEMSSDTSPKGTEHFNTALKVIEEELANDRALTAASISWLRDCVNEEVNREAQTHVAELKDLKGLTEADKALIARMYFYHPEALYRLGFDSAALRHEKNEDTQRTMARFTRFALPDPAGTTTLGEALMVLSLGTRDSRLKVMENFRKDLKVRLRELNLAAGAAEDHDKDTWQSDEKFFTLTYRVLGLATSSRPIIGGFEPLTAMQEEIIRALERLVLEKAKKAVQSSLSAIAKLEEREESLKAGSLEFEQLESGRLNLVRRTLPLMNYIRDRFGLNPIPRLTMREPAKNETAEQKEARKQGDAHDQKKIASEMRSFAASTAELNPLRSANARTAAADQMLKEIMIAVEDDIEYHFVQRMLNRLRKKITQDKIGVGVGVMQRTSMLATNRLIARVDPRASAQLGIGEEQNILQSVQQLAQIYTTAQTGGLLGTLGALDKQPREPPPEIYGINSGNNFQVTPIFDPSGQALRFKFDFVGATRIQEPNGTTSPQLSRIERHTVNTEVQLSNLELREISRFESNARIGLPTTYSGGLPIIKDIPKIRPYLPLLGWFVRKGGKAAVVQQSLIFGQTTMYPTVADIMDLLTAPVSTQ